MSDQQIIFSMNRVSKTFPSNNKQVLKDINLSFFYGAKIGIIGLNGSGKSTLLKIIAGLDKSFKGDVHSSKEYTTGYLSQEPELDESKTVIDIVKEGMQEAVDLITEYNKINNQFALPDVYENPDKMEQLMKRQGELQDQIDACSAWDLETKLNIAMDALRCPEADTPINVLSGGERRRVALCRLLLQEPDVLLLDVPTNHLDAETVDWLQRFLIDYKGTCLIVTHDRYFLDQITGWILELDRGKGLPYEGNYSSWLEQKTQRLELEGKEDKKKQKVLEKELEWIKQGAKARQAKQKARIKSYEELVNSSERVKQNNAQIIIPNGERLGSKVIEVKNLGMHFEDKILFDNLSFSLPPGGIVGIIGPNVSSKTNSLL